MTKKVAIYSPDGVEEFHTIPNARDLLNVGWSYDKTKKTTPFEPIPESIALTAEESARLRSKEVGQEIFDRYGTRATQDIIVPKPEGYTGEKIVTSAPSSVVEQAPVEEVVPDADELEAEAEEGEKAVELPRAGNRRYGKDKS
jgi:hypothetical protein